MKIWRKGWKNWKRNKWLLQNISLMVKIILNSYNIIKYETMLF